jgi:transposase
MDNERRLKELERRRRRGARLLEAGVPQVEVARRVGVTRTSVSRQEKRWQEGGISALQRPRHFAVRLTGPSVWRLLRALGWSVQRPTGQARQRNEKAIRTWKARRWPEPKKSLRDRAE